MPTIIDSLAIELSLDPTKLQEGLRTVSSDVKQNRDESERHFKVLDTLITNMGRSLAGLIATFVSLEAAIAAFAATKHISRAGTEFGNLAESIGMSVNQLGAWENAMERVGGRAGDIGSAFRFQQSEFQKSKLQGGSPAFLGYMQRLGMPEWHSYYNANGELDVDRFNKDLAEHLARPGIGATQRAEYLKGFGFDSPAAQRLFSGDINRKLEEAKRFAPTDLNTEAFRKLNEQWVTLGNAITAVKNDLVTNLFTPISEILKGINNALESLHKFGFQSFFDGLQKQLKESGFMSFLFSPTQYDDHGQAHSVPSTSGDVSMPRPGAHAWPGTTPAPMAPDMPRPGAHAFPTPTPSATPAPLEGPAPGSQTWAEFFGLSGSRTWGSWWQGLSSSGAAAAPLTTAPSSSTDTQAQPGTSVPRVPLTPGPQSSADQILALPKLASAPSPSPEGRNTVNNTVTTSIGSMTFQGASGQTGDIGQAGPYYAIGQDQFRNAKYSVNANSALE